MNNWIRLTGVAVSALLSFSSCDSGEADSTEQKNTNILQLGPWMVEQVLVGNKDETVTYDGMTLTFMPETYFTTNGAMVWPESGTWNFTSSDATSFERDGEIIVEIIEITKNKLVLEFPWQGTLGSGRTSSVEGNYRFSFTR